ncbi:TPA: hypothetical protein ACPZUU_002683 [Yersinia enterocolitica]|uniref:hypothetical protein n=1 Tax=Yersinia frederiksenii TaxID=29484 RepID=UPI0005E75E18|nr:hypothetical protein [Yersinia frederiksenii]EKN3339428.1 hypothetical protein [Yersinia enterocolitica]EKN3442921.1 hypothetical protein [Yersinia enterocolitica]EKN4796237.1 hypothetical protein [Yersinia enterocolitica]EKN5106727.1 hypothetical protein [Yersinia enterocolitica]ELW8171810.1 hypothetical protein [Yersinia enterocolitica]
MDLKKSLIDAKIIKVAIVDDDLSNDITMADLEIIDGDITALLGDPSDPDYQDYCELLISSDYDIDTLSDFAQPLSDEAIREQAPERLKTAANSVLASRNGYAEPVRRIKKLLLEVGVLKENIHSFSSPEIPDGEYYDLLVIDYYLVKNSCAQTLPFIQKILTAHEHAPDPLQIILMSTYEAQLKAEFRNIRPELKASSSRMRIMSKPKLDEDMVYWKSALFQLSSDRHFVSAVENFVTETSNGFLSAAREQADRLWELDLQAMDILHETATFDNDDFCRYVEECLSRQLLTALERYSGIRQSLDVLGDLLKDHRTTKVIAPVAEIGDSRAAIRMLMRSMEWRGGNSPSTAEFLKYDDPRKIAKWVQKNLRFGMVLKSPNGKEWLNLTQACDLAQTKEENLDAVSLLLISGSYVRPVGREQGQSLVYLNTSLSDVGSEVLCWDVRNVKTPTIFDFAQDFYNGWSITGELRLDQAQSIAALYSSRTLRVGLQKRLSSWCLDGCALFIKELNSGAVDAEIKGTPLSGHAMNRGKPDEIHIDRDSMLLLQKNFPNGINKISLKLYMGMQLKPGATNKEEGILIYCNEKPENIESLRSAINEKDFLGKKINQDKVVIALWHR